MPRNTSSKTAKKASAKRASKTQAGTGSHVTIRHYCQGIGDCHLMKFRKDDGADFWMLIDCGIHSSITGGTEKIAAIVADIASLTKKLDVIVVTHEHWDHVSAFLTEAEEFAKFTVGEVWMAWTEDPKDLQAQKLDKFKQHALASLQMASSRLSLAETLSPFLAAVHTGVESLLGFNFGAKGEKVRTARDDAKKLAKSNLRYLEPKNLPLTISGLSNLRVYVLGPPRDETLLGLTERASEMYGLGGGSPGWPLSRALTNALSEEAAATDGYSTPFDAYVGIELSELAGPGNKSDPRDSGIAKFFRDHYAGPAEHGRSRNGKSPDPGEADQSWRRIDHDWLGISADLAMQLDDRTNNTSLALAFEFVDSGHVLLFAADAQIGNWLSWHDLKWRIGERDISGSDLLARTVYYKVGHHGSHNATAKAKGLELMASQDLAAFIPTNEKDAKKVKWGQMPYSGILDELRSRTQGRVIRADDPWISTLTTDPGFSYPSGSIRDLRHKKDLCVELEVG